MSNFLVKLFRNGKLRAVRRCRNSTTLEGVGVIHTRGGNEDDGDTFGVFDFFGMFISGSVDPTSTMAVPGFVEFGAYDEATRLPMDRSGPLDISSPSTGRVDAVVTHTGMFSINASATLRGAFLASESTKFGIAGTLWGGGEFSPLAVSSGDELSVEYTTHLVVSDTFGSPE